MLTNIYFLNENSSIIVEGGLQTYGYPFATFSGYNNKTWKGIQFNSNNESQIYSSIITGTNKGKNIKINN